MFRDRFKYYKSRNPCPDLKDVIDLNKPNYNEVRNKLRKSSCFMYINSVMYKCFPGY